MSIETEPQTEWSELPAFTDGIPEALRQSDLFATYLDRLASGRDMKIFIDAEGNQTGVGKTLLGSELGSMMDIHGFDAAETATMNPREFMEIYRNAPMGSVAYLQESEMSGDQRRAMSKDVVNLGYTFMVLRNRQIFSIADLPDVEEIDDRIIKQFDFRILVKGRGEAIVFSIDSNDFTGEKYYNKTEYIHWENFERSENFRKLKEMKERWASGEMEEQYVHKDEVEKMKENFHNKFVKKTIFETVRGVYKYEQKHNGDPITQAELGNAIGLENEELALSQGSISNILNADDFEDYYSSLSD